MRQNPRPKKSDRRPRPPLSLLKSRLNGAISQRTRSNTRIRESNYRLVTLSDSDLKRVETLFMMRKKFIKPIEAQSLLGVSRSQIYKLLAEYRAKGAAGIASKRRGKVGNRAFPQGVRKQVIDLIQERYHDYGPTLVAEILCEIHGIRISRETIRQWMIIAGLWKKNRSERRRLHQPRKRMPAYGDLVQVDGSDHDWFEGRGPRCTAMVFVDDATGSLQYLGFFPSENRDSYFCATHRYILMHGRPVRIQTDKHSAVWSRDRRCEYTNALDQLTIIHSVAHSPQSKGRVERAHRTLQDRLVKAMRRVGICTIEEANAFVPQFVRGYNKRFCKPPACHENRHRSPRDMDEVDSAFSHRYARRVTKNLTFSFRGIQYLIDADEHDRDSVGSQVRLEIRIDKTLHVFGSCGRLKFRAV